MNEDLTPDVPRTFPFQPSKLNELYEPNELRSEEKAMNIDRVQELLRAHRARLKEEFHVEEIGLFGSFVRRENASQSDIDILVTFQKGHKDFFNYMRVKSFLEDLTGREVDLVLKDAIKPRLQDRILNEVEYVP